MCVKAGGRLAPINGVAWPAKQTVSRMRFGCILSAILALPPLAAAQNTLPPGTILPVSLDHGLNAAKAYPGEEVRAKVMQNVPGTAVHRGAEVLGHVVRVDVPPNGPARLTLRFDFVRMRRLTVAIKTNLRALASLNEVEAAEDPEEMSSRGLTEATWTTEQIGGEQVYRGGGPVADGLTPVGTPTPDGALGVPRVQPGQPCRGAIDGMMQPQALWLFSTNACGVYGYANIRIVHAGRTDPLGIIVLSVDKGKLALQSGTGMLLRVQQL